MSTVISKDSDAGQPKYVIDLSKDPRLSDDDKSILKAVFGNNDPLAVMTAPKDSPLRAHTQTTSYVLNTTGIQPLDLQITSPGHRLVMPSNCVITVTTWEGEMNIGPNWPFSFDALGHGIPNGQSYKADSGFYLPNINSYCAVVCIEGITHFVNQYVPDFGAGVSLTSSQIWLVGVNESGFVDVIYNDNLYPDNNGNIKFILNVTTGNS